MNRDTITLAITGASGTAYALRLLQCLLAAQKTVYLLASKPARQVIATETDLRLPADSTTTQKILCEHYQADPKRLRVFSNEQWTAPIASGSNVPHAMVVCPCTCGTLSAIAHGTSKSLIERSADVVLKERRQLILVPREMPFSVIHLENMLSLARMGVSILPACPGFYDKPATIDDLVDFVVARILDHLDIEHELGPRWGRKTATPPPH